METGEKTTLGNQKNTSFLCEKTFKETLNIKSISIMSTIYGTHLICSVSVEI